MATIAGSQFIATAPGQLTSVAFAPMGSPPPPVPGPTAFNLEVFVGTAANAPALAPGYQGLAVLSPSGLELDLIAGAFAVTDDGAGSDAIAAFGGHETISGGNANVTLTLNGNSDVAQGGNGLNTINVTGHNDVVFGGANDLVNVTGTGAVINGGTDGDTINVFSAGNTINGGRGPDTINVFSAGDVVNGGLGPDTINVLSAGDTINGGLGPDTINVFSAGDVINAGFGPDVITGSGDTINANMGPDTIDVVGTGDLIGFGPNSNVAQITGGSDTVAAGTIGGGAEQDVVSFVGGDMTFADAGGTQLYADTVIGFSQSAGDTIALNGANGGAAGINAAVNNQQSQNGGQDTLITLNNGSTILLKGVGHIDSSFFS